MPSCPNRSSLTRLTPLALAIGLAAPLPALAQGQAAALPQVSKPVVQPIPPRSAGMRLNDALGRLAKNPQDVDALAEAGRASLDLGDGQAAIGFYRRALAIQPENARVKAGLASAYVLSEDPFTAIELFDEAEKAGPIEPERLADRGLAFDLVGDNPTAQAYYRQSLAGAPSDETTRRLALSLAISRDRAGMERTLGPLLQKQDKAAWRTRAFGLAILGQTDEAESIARQTMPTEMATAITAYLRYMPRLTAAQQAAAANLGRFPRAAEIGNDDPRLAFYSRSRVKVAAAAPPPPAPAAAPATTGRKPSRVRGRDRAQEQSRPPARAKAVESQPVVRPPSPAPVPPPEPQVARVTAPNGPKSAATELPPSQPAPSPAPVPTPPPPPPPPPAPAPVQVAQAQPVVAPAVPGFDLAKASPPAPAPAPVRPTPAPPPAPRQTSIDEAFADLAPPSREVEPQEGAVDVRQIRPVAAPSKVEPEADAVEKDKAAKDKAAKDKAAKDKAARDKAAADKAAKEKAAKEKAKPSHPSRIWVQVATGRDKSALGFDWRRLARENPAVFKGRSPNVTAWGQANRLLAGPFATAREANAFLAQLKKAGIDGAFVWTSPAGQVVEALGSKR